MYITLNNNKVGVYIIYTLKLNITWVRSREYIGTNTIHTAHTTHRLAAEIRSIRRRYLYNKLLYEYELLFR